MLPILSSCCDHLDKEKTGKWSDKLEKMIPHFFDSGSELLNMWSSNVADVWVIRVGSVISGINECVNRVFKKLDVVLWELYSKCSIF